MAAYGGIEANQADVKFPFDLALPAAKDLWALAGKLRTAQNDRNREAAPGKARKDWHGPHRDTFDHHMTDEETDTSETVDGLRALARALASQWAAARGEQNRINWARWVDSEISDDGYGENVVEHFAGEDDYGDPPANPDVPDDPDFDATTGTLHPEFGP